MEWLLVAIILVVFYYKVIVPFSAKMLEQKVDEPIEVEKISFDDDELEDMSDRIKELRRKLEKELDLMGVDSEEKVRYEVMLERMREQVYSNPDQASVVIENLNKRE